MDKVRSIATDIFFSFPVRLLVRQIHKHKILLLFWVLLLALVSGALGESFGAAYLFLEPEYLGKENFWSFFLLGSTLGIFIFAYMITFYINESYRFHFIALNKSPFYTFSYNNLLVPTLFLGLYLWTFCQYHLGLEGGLLELVLYKVAGLLLGMFVVFLISATYFFANRTLIHYFGLKLEKTFEEGRKTRSSRWIILGKARAGLRTPQRTDSFLSFPFKVNKVGALQPRQLKELIRTLNQNHGKLILIQVMIFILIAVLSILEENPLFQIPAGASLILLLSLAILTFGAVGFWFRRSGILTLIGAACLIYLANNGTFYSGENPAFGLDYQTEAVSYDFSTLEDLNSLENYQEDRKLTLEMLENWKASYVEKHGKGFKPRAVFVTASGGGLRSAFWTFRVMQHLDSLSEGELLDETRLMSGASGGMYGLSYFRELYWRKQKGELECLQDGIYADNISRDLLNRIFFKKFSDIILPVPSVELSGNVYSKEVGYSFDDQLAKNLPEFANRRIADYTVPEQEGIIPVLVLEPTIINQGKKLYISSSPVSFLSRPNHISHRSFSRSSGVEFRRMFASQSADSLYFTTALRLNSTFPFILPIVELPSKPAMQVMDAGAIDNYGTQTAVKYLYEFKDWFVENTSGVVFIQVRDHTRNDPISAPSKEGLFSKLTTPLGGGYTSMIEAKDMSNDYLLEFVREWYEGDLEFIPIAYNRLKNEDRASMSWHLTQREKLNIESSLEDPVNLKAFKLIESLYKPRLLARNR